MASTGTAVRLLASKGSSGALQLRLRVKPGVSKSRQGIAAVDNTVIDVCVAAQAKSGEANEATVRVLSEALDVPKSHLTLSSGMRSRAKTVLLRIDPKHDAAGADYTTAVLRLLRQAVASREIGRVLSPFPAESPKAHLGLDIPGSRGPHI